MPIDLYPNIAKVKRNGAYQNLPGFVQQNGDTDIEAMIASKETSTTAQFAHAKDSFFILNDILYQTDADISVNDTIAVGTNCHVAILGDEVTELINDTISQYEMIEEINKELLHEVEIHFQRGAFAANGSFESGSTSYASTTSTIFGVDYIVMEGTYLAGFLFYNDDTYLGKLRPDGTLDKVAGNWLHIGGKINIRKLMNKFSANGFRMTVVVGSTIPSYEAAYNAKYCTFYSYSESSNSIDEKIQLEQGSYARGGDYRFNLTFASTRVRSFGIIKVNAGDVIEVNSDKGKYNTSYTYWIDLPGTEGSRITYDDFIAEGEKIRLAFDGYVLIVFSLASDASTNIPLSTFTGEIILHRYSDWSNIIENNKDQLKYAIGSQRNFTNVWASNVPSNNLATFVHVTDVHGDKSNFAGAYEVAKYIDADALINSGDTVYYYSSNDISFVANTVSDKEVDYIMCLGNHDGFQLTAEQQNEKFIRPFAEDYGYQFPDGVSNPTYYYKDYVNKKLRVLVVNQFEYDGQTSTTDTRMCFTQDQVNFIVSCLASTPQDYGVVIVMHTPERIPVVDASYPKFFQTNRLATTTFMTILTEIVDAFISGTTLSKSFDNPSGATPTSVSVSADFTGLNSGVEFIAFVCGHYHADQISYVPNATNKQLLLNSVTTNSWYGMAKSGINGSNNPYLTEGSDIQRIGGTPTQNSFNVYTIDRTNKTVRVVRIGANMPANMEYVRDYMVIPYAD